MSKPTVHVFIASSLDGFIATPEHGLEWLKRVERPDQDYGYSSFMQSVDAVFMGRKTYDIVLGFSQWPFEGKKVFVMTHRPLRAAQNEVALKGSLAAILDRPEMREFNKIYLDGGALIRAGLTEGVVDQITLSIVPVLLGNGIRLFDQLPNAVSLRTLATQAFESGLVQVSYQVEREA